MAGKHRWASVRLSVEPLERRDLLSAIPSPAANQPPTGADASVTTLEGSAYKFATDDFGFGDPDQEWIASGATSPSAVTAANVLVLYNTASAAGTEIAQYYAQIRPGVHLAGISGVDPNAENISADNYLSVIRPQVLAALNSTTDVIVTTKGLPLRIQVAQPALPLYATYVDASGVTRTIYSWKPYSSLESELASVDDVASWQMMGDQSYVAKNHFARNPYYWQDASFRHSTYDTRLTARLDGYSVTDVKAAIDRAQQAFIGPPNNPDGPFYFLVDNDPTKSFSGHMAMLPNNVLIPGGYPTVYDNTTAFVGTAPGPVIGYDSHGVRQAATPANYLLSGLTATLADGAVFESWESYNAYSFNPAPPTNQGQIAQWLQVGGTAGVGHVQEPTATRSTVTNEDRMFQMLLAGYTFAESAWSGNLQLSFVNTVVGDPLMKWQPLVAGQHALEAVRITTLPAAGVLTLDGAAVVAGQVVSAIDIAAGLLEFTPSVQTSGANYSNFTFQVQDDGGTVAAGSDLDPSPNTITINVTPVVSSLVVDLNGSTAGTSHTTFWSNAGAVNTTLGSATIVDVDGANLSSLTVAVTAGAHAGNVLSATVAGGITSTYNAGTGVLTLGGTDSIANYETVLRSVQYNNTDGGPGASQVTMRYLATDTLGSSASADGVVDIVTANGDVVGRYLFYNQSGTASLLRFDGNDAAINADDDNAIAIDKVAYLPGTGQATFANVSSYIKGINGIMVDIGGEGTHASITAADFTFRVGNNNTPSSWATAPAPASISVRAGAGVGGSDRVEIIWNSGDIFGNWLQVVTLANDSTGLPQLANYAVGYGDVFYFGSAPADTGLGDTANLATVDATDEVDVRNHPAPLYVNLSITNTRDFNRDAKVDSTDVVLVRNNQTSVLTATRFIMIDVGSPTNAPASGGGGDSDDDSVLSGDATGDAVLRFALTAPADNPDSSPAGGLPVDAMGIENLDDVAGEDVRSTTDAVWQTADNEDLPDLWTDADGELETLLADLGLA